MRNEVARSHARKHPGSREQRVSESTVGSVVCIACECVPVSVRVCACVCVKFFLIPFVVEWRVNKRMSGADGAEAFQRRIMNLAERAARRIKGIKKEKLH